MDDVESNLCGAHPGGQATRRKNPLLAGESLSLLVLGSYLVGVAFFQLRFDDERWYANAWTSWILVAIISVGVLIGNLVIRSGTVRIVVQSIVLFGLWTCSELLIVVAKAPEVIALQRGRHKVKEQELFLDAVQKTSKKSLEDIMQTLSALLSEAPRILRQNS